MRRAAIAVVTTILALLGSILLVGLSTFTVAISRAGDTALVVPGTGNPTPTPSFINAEVRNFVTPTNPACGSGLNAASPGCSQIGIDYPASFWPIILFGLKQLFSDTWDVSVRSGVDNLGTALRDAYAADPDGHFYLVGYSQGATVNSYFKRDYPTDPRSQGLPPLDQLTFVFAANPNRPNGGLFMRPGIFGPFTIPILDATVGIPAPTDTGVRTTDIVIQYDGVSDFPVYPINLLAVANATAGLLFIHPTYVYPNDKHTGGHPYGYPVDEFTALVSAAQRAADQGQCTEAVHCQQHGDTTYITLPTTDLPILAPLRYIGEQTGLSRITTPLADLVQPFMTVLIETGYDRTSYGTPTPFRLIPIIDPVSFTVDLVAATFQGINDATGDINGSRPAPLPTQDPFATAASLITDSSAPSGPPAAASTPTVGATATSRNTAGTTDHPATSSGGAGSTSSTLTMTNGAKFTPATGTTTPSAQDPVTRLTSGATNMVGSLVAGLTDDIGPATSETPTSSSTTDSDSTAPGTAAAGTTSTTLRQKGAPPQP
jgi:PE-PPE domain